MTRLIALTVLLIVASVSYAAEAPLWKMVGSWQVRVDTTLDNGCFAYQPYEGDTFLRIGINKLAGGVYIMVADADWKSLEAGKEYPVKLYFGDETPWFGDATALEFSGVPALMLTIASEKLAVNFLQEFMREVSVSIEYEEETIEYLSLKGTYKAGVEIIECQKAFDEAKDKLDPFENLGNSSDGNNDPFAI